MDHSLGKTRPGHFDRATDRERQDGSFQLPEGEGRTLISGWAMSPKLTGVFDDCWTITTPSQLSLDLLDAEGVLNGRRENKTDWFLLCIPRLLCGDA